jgi:hypothetical protein
MSNTTTEEKTLGFREVLNKAASSAARGGVAGACAMGANVACLMWMRTTVSSFSICFILSSSNVHFHDCIDAVL